MIPKRKRFLARVVGSGDMGYKRVQKQKGLEGR